MPTPSDIKKKVDEEDAILKHLSKAAQDDYNELKKRKNIRGIKTGVPWWIISKDLRGGYKKKPPKSK
jgi:hypothetical protein